ncbi:MAG: hypothetical protein HWE07_06410, partial [Cytophagia bacterium]|nr:hypothetical protein [Cytophagia bacterium]
VQVSSATLSSSSTSAATISTFNFGGDGVSVSSIKYGSGRPEVASGSMKSSSDTPSVNGSSMAGENNIAQTGAASPSRSASYNSEEFDDSELLPPCDNCRGYGLSARGGRGSSSGNRVSTDPLIAAAVREWIRRIQEIVPNFRYDVIVPSGSPTYTMRDIQHLRTTYYRSVSDRGITFPEIYPRGRGASFGELPAGYVYVSRWIRESEVPLWVQNQGTSIPRGVGAGGRVYVTLPGAPRPGGTGPVRVDFALPARALQRASKKEWFQVMQPASSTPIYNVTITMPE